MENKTLGVMFGSFAAVLGLSYLSRRSGSLAEEIESWMKSIGGRDPRGAEAVAEEYERRAAYFEDKTMKPMRYQYDSNPEEQRMNDRRLAVEYRNKAEHLRKEAALLRSR